MPRPPLSSLLLSGALCLPLAACGSDDPAPQAAAPVQTVPATTATTPATTTEDAAATTTSRTTPPVTTTAAPPDDGSARQRSTPTTSTPPAQKPKLDERLAEYAKGGKKASASEATAVRGTLNGFLQALAAKDAAKVCSFTVGLPATSDPKKPGFACDTFTKGKPTTQTSESRKLVADAKVTVKGEKALVRLNQGMPMPMRKIDGQWKIDYATLLSLSPSAG